MEIERDEKKKIISVWLTKAESQDEDLQRRLKTMYPKWKNIWLLFITPVRKTCLKALWHYWLITKSAVLNWL